MKKPEKPTNFVLHASEYKGEQKATFYLGKCALYGNGKRNAVEVSIFLRTKNDGRLAFTASGAVWNQTHTDICRGGQCLDDPIFTERAKTNKLLAEILRFWNLYHLNDCNAGTPEQDECIAKMPADYFPEGETINGFTLRDKWDTYILHCLWLRKNGLYEVPDPRDPSKSYKYGSGWLYREIPAADLARIREILADARAEYQKRG